MLLNLTIILDYLNDTEILYKRTDKLRKRLLKIPVFYSGEHHFQADRLYIAYAEKLPQNPEPDGSAALICLGYPPAAYNEQAFELLCLPTSADPFALMNRLSEIFHQFHEYEQLMEQAVRQKQPFEAISDVALSIFQTPVSAFDRYDKYLFLKFMPDRPEFLENYLNMSESEYSFDEEYNLFHIDKDFLKTYEAKGPTYSHSPIYGTASIFMNIFEGSQYMGRVLIEDAYRPFRDSDYALIEWLEGYLKNLIIRTGKFYFGTSKEFELMMRGLLLKQAPWKKEYESILKQHGWEPNDTYQCLHICAPADTTQSMDINNGAFYLRDFFDCHYVLVHQDSIYQVINISRTRYSKDERRKRLNQFLKNNHFAAGLSIEFSDFTRTGFYLRQATLAVNAARQISGGLITKYPAKYTDTKGMLCDDAFCRIVDFEKDVFQLMLQNAKGDYSGEFYCTNAVLRLLAYDKENNADLVPTLKCYLENNLNATKTQELLHIARTTCLYRVQRIESIMGVDLKETEVQLYLLLLFRMLRMA